MRSRSRSTARCAVAGCTTRSEEHTSELQSQSNLVCRLLLEKKKNNYTRTRSIANSIIRQLLTSYTTHYLSGIGIFHLFESHSTASSVAGLSPVCQWRITVT